MDRRSLVRGGGLVVATGVVGCFGRGDGSRSSGGTPDGGTLPTTGPATEAGSNTDRGAPRTSSADGTTPQDAIEVRVHNDAGSARRVHLSLSADAESMLDTTVALEPGESIVVDTGIEEAGRYHLVVTIDDGLRESYPFTVDDYALRRGSDVLVDVSSDDVWIAIEE